MRNNETDHMVHVLALIRNHDQYRDGTDGNQMLTRFVLTKNDCLKQADKKV